MFAAPGQLLTPSASGPSLIPFDAIGASNHATLTSAGITVAHTLDALATAILVSVSNYKASVNYSSMVSNSCLIGATPLSLLGFANCNNTTGSGWEELWGAILTAGALTGAQTITYKEALTGTTYPATFINSASYKNVASFGTAVTAFGAGTTQNTGPVTSQVGDLVFVGETALAAPGVGMTPTGTGTARYNPVAVSGYATPALQDIPGASAVAGTTTATGGWAWATVAVDMVHI